MWLYKLFNCFKRQTSFSDARKTYGDEPYRTPAEVTIEERIQAIFDGTTKYLLRDVLGFEAVKNIPEPLHAKKFRELFPTTGYQIREYIRIQGVSKRVAIYSVPDGQGTWIFQENNKWQLVDIDERGMPYEQTFQNKWEADIKALNQYWPVIESFIAPEKNKSENKF